MTCTLADTLVRDESGMHLIIRDQKTSGTMGSYKCPLESPVEDLVEKWVGEVRASLLRPGREHDRVFLNPAPPMYLVIGTFH